MKLTKLERKNRSVPRRLGLENLEARVLLAGDLASDAAFDADLVHHWSFDEGRDWHNDPFDTVVTTTETTDYVGSADGTLVNMTKEDWVSGRQFSALEFDGQDDYVDVGTTPATTLGSSSSLSFWLQTTSVGTVSPSDSPGVAGANSANGNSTQWGWIDTHGRINLSVDRTTAATSAARINDGQWHHVVLTRNATTGDAHVYVDGELSGQGTGPTGVKTTSFSSLGKIENSTGEDNFFEGRLDQVHLFNDAIAAGTAATLYSNQTPITFDGESNIISPAAGYNTTPFSTHSATMGFAYDYEQDSLTVSSFEQPAHGTVTPSTNGDGSFVYSANAGFFGSDQFDVIVTDGNGGFSQTTLSVKVIDPVAASGIGTAAFSDFQAIKANGVDVDFSTWSVPRSIDWNKDGINDILVGAEGAVWLHLNTGTASAPAFAAGTKVSANGSPISLGVRNLGISLADMNGDGVDDLVAAQDGGDIFIFHNTATGSQSPVFSLPTRPKTSTGSDLSTTDIRFDIGDFDNDGLNDIAVGSFSNGIHIHKNVGTATQPRFAAAEQILTGSYNVYPRFADLDQSGSTDLLRGFNWGNVQYSLNSGGSNILDGATTSNLNINGIGGAAVDVKAVTNGPIVDLADFNGDNVPDLLVGSQSDGGLFIAYGVTPEGNIDDIEAIYDANLTNLGTALSANDNALLNEVKRLSSEYIDWAVYFGSPAVRQTAFNRIVQHINKYPQFLKFQVLTGDYKYVASIASQNWLTLHQLGPNTVAHRRAVADAVGATGGQRDIYLEHGIVIGDAARASVGQLSSIKTFLDNQAGILFPDTQITIDRFWGDGSDGRVNVFTSAKNVFKTEVGRGASEWRSDLAKSITDHLGRSNTRADLFTFVVGHEVTHSADKYVRSRANGDLERRWGQTLALAAGPDFITGQDGWIDYTTTQAHWKETGLWDEDGGQLWDDAVDAYWDSGPGSGWVSTSFMRNNVPFILSNTQESLATQANQHWADSEGRIVGAIDRFYDGVNLGIDPMKANITEVLHFLDIQSAGMNKVKMYDIDIQASPPEAVWNIYEAQLERNDLGYITRVAIDDRWYEFTVDTQGVVTDVLSNVFINADLNFDSVLDCADADRLSTAIVRGGTFWGFDLNKDGTVNRDDLSQWLQVAGEKNLGTGHSYAYGDANLDGAVDDADYAIWKANQFTAQSNICAGDFNADGFVDSSDFNLWNLNRTIDSLGGQSGNFEFANEDVNQDGTVSAIDALRIINFVNTDQDETELTSKEQLALDVNGDGTVAPLDALMVINHMMNAESAKAATASVSQASSSLQNINGLSDDEDDEKESSSESAASIHDSLFENW